MPTNDRAKFDAASFILGGEMHNRTNTRNYKKKTNKQQTIYPNFAYPHVWIISKRKN